MGEKKYLSQEEDPLVSTEPHLPSSLSRFLPIVNMKFKLFFLLLSTSLVAFSNSTSSNTCDGLENSQHSLSETSIQLHKIESEVTKASDDGIPLPQDLTASYPKDRHAARQNLGSALQRLQRTVRMLNDQGSGKQSESLDKLEEQLQLFHAKISSQEVDQGVSSHTSTKPSEHGNMDFTKLLKTIRTMQNFSSSANKLLAATIKKKCASGSLEARQDLSTILDDVNTLLTDLLDDLNSLSDSLNTLLRDLLDNLDVILTDLVTLLFNLLSSLISAISDLLSSLLG